jgi:hypothetical protein
MDVSGITGTAWRDGEVVGDFVLNGGREPAAGGRVVEHVEIRFTNFTSTDVMVALDAIAQRRRLSSPLNVDLELDDGRRLEDCEPELLGGVVERRDPGDRQSYRRGPGVVAIELRPFERDRAECLLGLPLCLMEPAVDEAVGGPFGCS